jgi:glycerophosphoryl diester phosphodiesterase
LITLIEKFVDGCFALIPRRKPKASLLKKTWIIAHRGAHDNTSGCIENTMPAFDKAFQLGCYGIEFDVHATADKQLVINHDPDLNRLWRIDKKIADLTLKELRKLAPNVPLLSEVVKKYGKKMHLFVELKAPFQDEQALLDCLAPLNGGEDYHLISLHESVFITMHRFDRKIMFLIADVNQARKYCQISLEKHYAGVMGHYLFLSKGLIKKLRDAGQETGVGFVESTNSLYREVNRGIFWLFTNKPEAICRIVNNN